MTAAPEAEPGAPRRRSTWKALALGWLAVLLIVDDGIVRRHAAVEVVLDSTVDSVAQVYFDVGKGFTEEGSVTRRVDAGLAQRLEFEAPPGGLRAIRLDPLRVAGSVYLREAVVTGPDGEPEPEAIDLARTAPLNQIARLEVQRSGVRIVTSPGAVDPQVMLTLDPSHLSKEKSNGERIGEVLGIDLGLTFGALLLGAGAFYLLRKGGPRLAAMGSQCRRPFDRLHVHLDRWSERCQVPGLVRVDRLAWWFYGLVTLFFGVCALAGLHGSSIDVFSSVYPLSDVQTAPLLGQPQQIRSDEWYQQTPAMLNQAFRAWPFHVVNTATGPGKSALLSDLPCWHFTQFFRPEFWAFAVLPFDQAYAFYWQAKGFLLLTGVFTLLLVLSGSSGAAALGALWFYFSAYTQWAYSWPTLLPDMIGLFCWVMCLMMYMTVGRGALPLALAALVCAGAAIDFGLCAYPPQQIPLILFGVALTLWWAGTRRGLIGRPDGRGRRALALSGCWAVIGIVMAAFYLDARPTLETAFNTVYPGRRVSSGGGVAVGEMVSHFLDFWKSPSSYPRNQGNITEASGYLWLAPIALLINGARPADRQRAGALLCCCAPAALLVAWMLLPIPAAAGHWVFFDKVPSFRCIHALGLLNVAIVCLCLAPTAENPGVRAPERTARAPDVLRWAAVGFLGWVALSLVNEQYHGFFPAYVPVFGAAFVTMLIFCLCERAMGAFSAVLLLPLVLSNGLINPVQRGFAVIEESTLFKAVRADRALRQGSWLVFSQQFVPTGFVVATGVKVLNSFKYVPDLKTMALFDPDGRYASIYNQSGHLIVRPLPEGEPSRFERLDIGMVRWSVSPLDPALKRAGVRYLVFDEAPSAEVQAKLRFLAAPSTPKLHVYELP